MVAVGIGIANALGFLNQVRAGLRSARAWFLKIDSVWIVSMCVCVFCVCVCVCVCVRPQGY